MVDFKFSSVLSTFSSSLLKSTLSSKDLVSMDSEISLISRSSLPLSDAREEFSVSKFESIALNELPIHLNLYQLNLELKVSENH